MSIVESGPSLLTVATISTIGSWPEDKNLLFGERYTVKVESN